MHLRDLVVLLLINMRSGEVKVIKIIESRKGTGMQPLDVHPDLYLPLPAAMLPSPPPSMGQLYTWPRRPLSALEDSRISSSLATPSPWAK